MPNVAAFLADSAKVVGRGDALPMKPDTCGYATMEKKKAKFILRIFDKAIDTDLLTKRGATTTNDNSSAKLDELNFFSLIAGCFHP